MTRKVSTNPRLFVLVAGALSLFFVVSLRQGLSQQDPAEKNERQQQSGMSTGTAHAPVKDALLRPITAGGFVDGAPVVFADITHAAGVAHVVFYPIDTEAAEDQSSELGRLSL